MSEHLRCRVCSDKASLFYTKYNQQFKRSFDYFRCVGFIVVALESSFIFHLQGGARTASERQLYLNERNRIWCYYRNLPLLLFWLVSIILILTRLLLLPLWTGNRSSLLLAKLKGLFDGFLHVNKNKRYAVGLGQTLSSIIHMNQVTQI